MTRARVVVTAGLLVLALATSAILRTGSAGSPPVLEASGTLELDGPTSVRAGLPFELAITGAAPGVSEASVVIASTAATTAFDVPLASGRGLLTLGSELTAAAGTTTVWVVAGGDEAAAHVAVAAGEAVDPVIPLVGPKSIVADGDDHAMVVALPEDRFGNPAADAATTRVAARRPDGRIDDVATQQTGLVVWQRLYSGTAAGRTEVAVTVGEATGPIADLDEVAGPPVAFSLHVATGPREADGRSLHLVQTDQLFDRFGNLVPDGTAVSVIVDEPTGRRQATVMTIDGRAELHLEAPDVPGILRVRAETTGVTSEVLELEFVTPWLDR